MNLLKNIAFSLILFISLPSLSLSQDLKNWFHEDPEINRFAGISSDRLYEKHLAGKKSTPVIVAVIDGGTDVTHPDLKDNLWINRNESPGNGIDDDKNGYADDIHGWNFIGGKSGDVGPDNLEAVRVYNRLKPVYEGKQKSAISASQKDEYELFLKAKNEIEKELTTSQQNLVIYERLKAHMDKIKTEAGTEIVTASAVMEIKSDDEEFSQVKTGVADAMKNNVSFEEIYKDIMSGYKHFYSRVNFHYNIDFDPRKIVNDNYDDYGERIYGNNSLAGPDAEHGTHVAGIIGAVRNNDLGINGIAKDVQIMVLRVVPDGDERDKDVANAIRYAADNGAKIINMSFGKSFSPGKKHVDEAVKYATSKDVLIVHAAGNDSENIDKITNYPTPFYLATKTREPAWIEVGAINSSGHIADFSNYGKRTVDVFAPGVAIYSTMPGAAYAFEDGTSMAAPVVSGIAALIRSYYPHLSAIQVKQAIVESVIKVPYKTTYPGSKKKVKFRKLSVTGGFVNAYKAVLTAETLGK